MADDTYSSARLKIDRAKHHIGDLQRRAGDIPRENYSLVVEVDPETGRNSYQFTSKPLSPDLGLIFGDAVTNLRSALDHCYCAALGPEGSKGQIYFPIRDNRQAIEAHFNKGSEKRPVSDPLRRLIIDKIKPYDREKGGHPTLTALNKLANTDKHRILLSVAGLCGISASFTHPRVGVFRDITVETDAGKQTGLFDGPGALYFDSDPKPVLEILIGEREPRLFYRKAVVPTLLGLADDVSDIVAAIASVVPR